MRRLALAARVRPTGSVGRANDNGHASSEAAETPRVAPEPPASGPATSPWVLPALRAALDAMSVAAVVVDHRGRIVLANRRARALEGRENGALAREIATARRGGQSSFVVTELADGGEGYVLAVRRADGANIEERLACAAKRHGLTRAQARVLGYLMRGMPNRTIAQTLAISERTVEAHVTAVLEKLAVESRAAAVAKALGDATEDD